MYNLLGRHTSPNVKLVSLLLSLTKDSDMYFRSGYQHSMNFQARRKAVGPQAFLSPSTLIVISLVCWSFELQTAYKQLFKLHQTDW